MSVTWSKIILFGDSLVQRSFDPNEGLWGTLLANRFQRICDVIPRGVSGYTSRSGRNVMPYVFPEPILNVEAFIIFFGTNDYSGVEDPSGDHVPAAEYSENLREIIKYAGKIGISSDKIILITPGPYCDVKFQKWCEELGRTFPKRDFDIIASYVEVCLEISKELGVSVINTYEEMMKNENWRDYLLDGVHLAKEGSILLYNQLLSILEKRIDTTEWNLPYWRVMNPIYPAHATPEICTQKTPAPAPMVQEKKEEMDQKTPVIEEKKEEMEQN